MGAGNRRNGGRNIHATSVGLDRQTVTRSPVCETVFSGGPFGT